MMNMIKEGLENNGLIMAFAIIGIVMYIAYFLYTNFKQTLLGWFLI